MTCPWKSHTLTTCFKHIEYKGTRSRSICIPSIKMVLNMPSKTAGKATGDTRNASPSKIKTLGGTKSLKQTETREQKESQIRSETLDDSWVAQHCLLHRSQHFSSSYSSWLRRCATLPFCTLPSTNDTG